MIDFVKEHGWLMLLLGLGISMRKFFQSLFGDSCFRNLHSILDIYIYI